MARNVTMHFEFIGGCWDGMSISSDSSNKSEAVMAAGLFVSTAAGSIGQRVAMMSPHAMRSLATKDVGKDYPGGELPSHIYEIMEKLEEISHVLLRAKYIETNYSGRTRTEPVTDDAVPPDSA